MPDTNAYLFLGLGVVAGISGLYVTSLLLRFKNALKDIALLQSLKDR
jgi:hypothetical protein